MPPQGAGEMELKKETLDKLESLNRSMIDKAPEIVGDNEPASDLWPQFRQALADYKRKRNVILESENPKTVQSDPEPKAERQKHDTFNHKIPLEDICVPWPLSSPLQITLQITTTTMGNVIQNEEASRLRLILSDLVTQGELLYHYATRAVVRILEDTVVKITKSDDTETHVLHYIHENLQQIPAPKPLGMLMIGKWSYTFTSFIQGIRLDRIWGNLTADKKSCVREQLNHIFTELRQLPGPSGEGYLGGGTLPVCKGGHRFTRSSSSPIASEAHFNDFLLEDSLFEPARVDYIHRCLSTDHRIVMTHGDLCPLNILVESEDWPGITGIVDWERGGAYPEYWEYVQAIKLSFDSQDDWCLYLPEAGIGRFLDEYAKYRLIGAFARG